MSLPTAAAPASPVAARRRAGRAVAIGATIALVVLGAAWELALAPIGRGTLVIKVLPLLPALAGMLRDRLVAWQASCLLVWLYVGEALVRSVTEPGLVRALALAELVLALVLFSACVVVVRSRAARAA